MQAAGARMVLVDMRGPGGPLVTDLADRRHPNDGGYVKMANIWFRGVEEVISKGMLSAPSAKVNSTSTSSSSTSSTTSEGSPAPMSNRPVTFTSAGIRNTEDVLLTIFISFLVVMWL